MSLESAFMWHSFEYAFVHTFALSFSFIFSVYCIVLYILVCAAAFWRNKRWLTATMCHGHIVTVVFRNSHWKVIKGVKNWKKIGKRWSDCFIITIEWEMRPQDRSQTDRQTDRHTDASDLIICPMIAIAMGLIKIPNRLGKMSENLWGISWLTLYIETRTLGKTRKLATERSWEIQSHSVKILCHKPISGRVGDSKMNRLDLQHYPF